MAQLRILLLLFIFHSLANGFVKTQDAQNINDVKFESLAQFVLNTFNDKPGKSIYSYNSAKIINAHKQNDSDTDYYLQLKFSVSCHADIVPETECFPKDLICEVVVTDDPITGSRTIQEDDTKCVLPTHEEEEESQKEHTLHTLKKEDEDMKSAFATMPPFLLTHNIDHMMAVADEASVATDVDERMVVAEEPVVEEEIVKKSTVPREVEEPVVKKQGYCTGCVTDIRTDLPELQEVVDEALTMIDENTNGVYKHNLVKITRAQTQVVNGIKYILTLEVAETYCLKTSGQDRETCEPSSAKSKSCVVEFLVKPWHFSRNIISNTCTQDDNNLENDIEPNFENEIVPHFDNKIESQFESEIEPQLGSEIKPFFSSKSESDRKGIFDYLDDLDNPADDMETTGFEEKYSSRVFEQPEDLDFEDIEPKERSIPKIESIESKQPTDEEVKLEEQVPVIVDKDQSRKSSEEDQDNRQSELAVERQMDDGIKSEESSEESKEKDDPKVGDESFVAVEVAREVQAKEDASKGEENSEESLEKVDPKETDKGFVGGIYRKKREVRNGNHPGGLKNISATEKKLVSDLAELAVRTLDEIDADDSKRVVLDILDAKKQLVDGVMYHLKLRVGSTSCEENQSVTNGCLQDQIATPKICSIQLHRSFAADSPNDVKVVKSECTNEPRGRHRRSGRKLIGGYETANISDPYIQEIASFALSELDKGSNSLFRQTVVRIVEAQQQVVSGLNIRLTLELGDSNCRKGEDHTEPCQLTAGGQVKQICRVEVWDQPWLKNRVMTNSSCETSDSRTKRSTPSLRGAPQEISVDDPNVQEIAKFSLAQLDGSSNSLNAQKIVKVVHATRQVVSGTKYQLTLELGSTTCLKGQGVDVASCDLKEGSVTQICHVEVWDQPWLEKRVMTNSSCETSESRTKRSTPLLGGPQEISVNDPDVLEIAKFSLAQLDGSSNSLNAQKIVKVVHATRQVVSGSKYQLTLELGSTTCRKGQGVDVASCDLKEGSVTQICHVEVWDQPWLEKRVMTNSSCETSESRTKRSTPNVIVGGPRETSVDDPDVQKMAKFSLAHLDSISNALYAQKIVKVLHATQQVVAGTKYHLTIELGYSTCRKGQDLDVDTCDLKEDSNNQICHVEIWSRPWLNDTRVLNASCTPSVMLTKRSLIGRGTHDIHVGLFRDFVAKHDKQYPSEVEYKRRFRIFRANMKKVQVLQQTERGTAKYGATRFADLTSKEFKKYHLGLRQDLKTEEQPMLPTAKIPNVPLPPEFDWRNYNAVTPVKNQGMCGSCWAFSVTGNVEGQWALRRGELLSLSEQELVDCDKLDDGCKGGLPENAYKAITTLGGLETESDYPYEGDDEKCHFNKTEVKVTVIGGLNITKNETQMAQWLVKNGPISIGINANAMQFYMGGVSHPWKMLCNANDLDHGVLIVGFGVHNYPLFKKSLPYWIIKNSWGEMWGEQGYYRVYRGDGTCGVNQMATSSVIG